MIQYVCKPMKSKKKLKRKKTSLRKGAIGSGMMFVMILVLIAGAVAFTLIGGQLPQLDNNKIGNTVVVVTPAAKTAQKKLQLYTFLGMTITPTIPPGNTIGCDDAGFNLEDEILWGSDPGPGKVASSGKIRVWVTDEGNPKISDGEKVDPTTGAITKVGDRGEKDTGTDGEGKYLWEPTIYTKLAVGAPPTEPFCDATPAKAATCTPRFPDFIKGDYNPDPKPPDDMVKKHMNPVIDSDYKDFRNGPKPPKKLDDQTAEFIWDVTKFQLTPGTYWAQFVIHDGDDNVGISCITVQIP